MTDRIRFQISDQYKVLIVFSYRYFQQVCKKEEQYNQTYNHGPLLVVIRLIYLIVLSIRHVQAIHFGVIWIRNQYDFQ